MLSLCSVARCQRAAVCGVLSLIIFAYLDARSCFPEALPTSSPFKFAESSPSPCVILLRGMYSGREMLCLPASFGSDDPCRLVSSSWPRTG
jgi:hypothetical protein